MREGYLTVAEVAAICQVSARVVQTWCKHGYLPSYQVGRAYRVPREDFDAWRKGRKVEPKVVDVGQTFEVELAALVQAWLWDMANGPKPRSPETIRIHRMHVYKYVRLLVGDAPEARLLLADAINDRALLRVLGRIPVVQFATRYNVFMALMSFCNFLVQQGVLAPAIKDTLKPHKPRRLLPPRRPALHSTDEVNRLIEAIWMSEGYSTYEKHLNAALVGTMVFAGLRVSEVANLELIHVDLTSGLLHVYNGKGGKSRVVGLNQRLKKMIEDYLRLRPGSDCPRLFLAAKGSGLNRDLIIKRLGRLSRRTGLKVSAHGLRRTFATLNANAGKSLNLLQLALGHADIKTTQQYLMADQMTAATAMQSW